MSTINMNRAEVQFAFDLPLQGSTPVSIIARIPWRDTETDARGEPVTVVETYLASQLSSVTLQDAWNSLKASAEAVLGAAGQGSHTVNEGP